MPFLEDALSGAAAGYGYNELNKSLDQNQQDARSAVSGLKDMVGQNVNFQPFGVTSAVGSNQAGPNGMQTTLSPEANYEKLVMKHLGGQQLLASSQDPYDRQNQLYGQMQQAMAPEQQRELQRMNEQLMRSGRSGMTSATYGGTPEQLAYQKALQESASGNWLQSGTQANSELMDQYKRGEGLMGMSWKPDEFMQDQGSQTLVGANDNNAMAVERAGMLSQLGIGGMNADMNFQNIKSNNFGNLVTGLTGQGGIMSSGGGVTSEIATLLRRMGINL
jgi:hypothetical protein